MLVEPHHPQLPIDVHPKQSVEELLHESPPPHSLESHFQSVQEPLVGPPLEPD